MTTALTRLSGSAFEVTLTLPWVDVKAVYDKVFDELAAEIEAEGFRKGKAPAEVLQSKIDKSKIYSEVVNRILPDSYAKSLEEHGLKPVIAPKVQIISAEEEKDWQFIIKGAEKPHINLNNYQETIKTINAKGKIWTPASPDAGQGEPDDQKKNEEERQKRISEIIDKLLEVCTVELAEILVESEVNRLTSQLIDDVRQAGLTFEQYLASKGQTADQIKAKYHQQAQTALKLEFILDAVAEDLKVQVGQEEIDAIINKESDSEKKKALQDQSYLLASILRRENTITKLLAL